MAKKTTTTKAAKKVAAKKAAPQKTAAKKAPAKKVAVKKTAAAKAPVANTTPAKKAAKKAAPAKKAASVKKAAPAKTSIIARVDVGFGNSLFIRGEGAGLSWDQGVQLDNVSPYEWSFTTTKAKGDINFKFLINDEIWAEGDDLTVAEGGTSISSPVFAF